MRFTFPAILLLLACSPDADVPADQQTRERAFEESMRGAVLDGYFTTSAQGDQPEGVSDGGEALPLRRERYEIEKAVKRAGDIWTFHARMQFGDRDVTLPVPVKLVWADDTPMVSVTDLGLPGMGTYTARVVFYRDSYSGMWWGGKYGGNLFGRIDRPE